MTRERDRHIASLVTARFIPPFLVLIVAYASYVVVGPLAIDYLINPPPDTPSRLSAGLAIPIVYLALLIPVAVTWLRLLLVVWTDPGYIPQHHDTPLNQEAERQYDASLELFWTRDVFVCDSKGLPIWCDYCKNFKPDRTRHNQDTGRCTRKMDHFCPWVGGVVGERSLKFFIQFLFYTMILTLYLLIVFAYFGSKYKQNVHWFVTLGLAGFFFFFTAGMVVNSLHLVFTNTTTVESIKDNERKMFLAVVLPPELQADSLTLVPPAVLAHGSSDNDSERPLTSEIDDPSHTFYFERQSRPTRPMGKSTSDLWKTTITYPLALPTDRPPLPAPLMRKFAVIEVPTGLNPWDLGSSWLNFATVFGDRPHDWLLPYRHSPCCDHSSLISEFPLGPQFEQLLRDVGLLNTPATPPEQRPRRTIESRKRKPRLDPGWQNGERPNGWLSEKEARRMRNEWRRQMRGDHHRDVP